MNFIELGESDHRKFNDYVASQNTGSFLQSWDWGDLQLVFNNKQVFRFIVTEGQKILLSAQALKIPLFANQYYLYIPYGPVVTDEFDISVLEFFFAELRNRFPEIVFIRTEPKFIPPRGLIGKKTVNIQPGKTIINDLTLPEDEILTEMHNKTRYNIKVAQKHGLIITNQIIDPENEHPLYKECLNLILETAKRQSYHTHPYSYYDTLIRFFSHHERKGDISVYLYQALYKNQLLATAIMIDFDATRTYLFGGSSNEYRNVMAPHLLHFQAMIDAKVKGLKHYDFDGVETASGKEAGFTRFKLGFGGHIVQYAGSHDLVNKTLVYWSYKFLRGLNRYFRKFKY